MEDIERTGHEGDVVKVADGFARNYLIPRKFAVQATKGALKDLENRRAAISGRESEKRVRAQHLAEEMSAKRIVVRARAGEGQRIHGQVTTGMIADAAKEQLGMEIDRRDIDITESIRELGDYLVSATIYKEVAAQLPISVVREEDEDGAEADEVLWADLATAPAASEEAEEADEAEADEEIEDEDAIEEDEETDEE
jgi:large subunit ribosomal protein L9